MTGWLVFGHLQRQSRDLSIFGHLQGQSRDLAGHLSPRSNPRAVFNLLNTVAARKIHFAIRNFLTLNPLRTLLTFPLHTFAYTTHSKPLASLVVLSVDSQTPTLELILLQHILLPLYTQETHNCNFQAFSIHDLGSRANCLSSSDTSSSLAHEHLLSIFSWSSYTFSS